MTKKECFINEVKAAIDGLEEKTPEVYFSEDALDFWNGLMAAGDTSKPKFTENGKLILKFMIDAKEDFNNLFKAKDIGERISVSSRTVSGALRKLVTDGYVEKIAGTPTVYVLTEKGENANFDEE